MPRTLPAALLTVGALTGAALGAGVFSAADGLAPAAPSAKESGSAEPRPDVREARRAYGRLPIAFEANSGRMDDRVKFLARGAGYTLFLTGRDTVLKLRAGKERSAVVQTRLVGASQRPSITPERPLPGKVHVLRGNDPSKWRTGISTWRRIRYEAVYPGIDLVYYGRQGRLEYDFVVAPGANPKRIGFELSTRRVRLDSNGDLLISTAAGPVRHLKPVAYQEVQGQRRRVAARFVIDGRRVSFELGAYDRTRQLVIDPVLAYSTFIGGSANETANAIQVDSEGNAYIGGNTNSDNFPLVSARDSDRESSEDGFITKLNPSGTAAVFSTYFGGSGTDWVNALDVDASGNVYVAGYTGSANLPVPSGADTSAADPDGYAAKISADGSSVIWGTYLGGASTDYANAIAVTSDGDAWVAGQTFSNDMFTSGELANAKQAVNNGGYDAFLVRIKHYTRAQRPCYFIFRSYYCPPLMERLYATYLGGTAEDVASGVAVDSSDAAYITGHTNSIDSSATTTTYEGWPTKTGPALTDPDGSGTNTRDAFVAKLVSNPAGDDEPTRRENSLVYSSYFGGTGADEGNAIAVTAAGAAQVVGQTASSDGNLANTEPAPLDRGSGNDGFVTSVSTSGGSFSGTAYLGGNGDDKAHAIAITERTFFKCTKFFMCTSVTVVSQYIAGETRSSDFPGLATGNVAEAANSSTRNSGALSTVDTHAFALKRIPGTTNPLLWSMYIGGINASINDVGLAIAVDSLGKTYLAGRGAHPLPTTPGSFQPATGGAQEAFVAKLEQRPPTILSGPAEGAVITSGTVDFDFEAEPGMTFYCSGITSRRLDNKAMSGCGAPKSYAVADLDDGAHTFGVSSVDAGGAQSDPATRTFVVDTAPPAAFDLVSPADGATTGPRPTLSWQQAADAGTPVSYQVIVGDQVVQTVSSSACTGGTCSAELANALATGEYRWRIRAVDGANRATDSSSTWRLVATDPPTARLAIAPNPALAGRPVTFDGSASQDAAHVITGYEWDLDGDGTFEIPPQSSPTTSRSYDRAQTVNVSLRVTDATGATATTSGELRVNAIATGTQIGVSINEGAQYTNKPDVDLTVNFPPSTTSLLVANDGGFVKGLNFAPARLVKWRLDSSGPERLPKTVYLRFMTGTFASPNYTDDIILDERPPVVDQAALVGGPVASSALAAALRTYKVAVKARDSNSGVRGVQITANKRKPGKLLRYTARTRGKRKIVRVKSAQRPRFLRAKDLAGNYSRWKKLK